MLSAGRAPVYPTIPHMAAIVTEPDQIACAET